MMKPIHQRFDVGRVSTTALIFSVTEVKVCPGPMTGGLVGSVLLGCASAAMSLRLRLGGSQIRVRVADRRQVRRPRPGVQLGHHAVVERRFLSFITRLLGSLMLPKTMAPAGQAAWQAVTTSPSLSGRPLFCEAISASRMRCTQ